MKTNPTRLAADGYSVTQRLGHSITQSLSHSVVKPLLTPALFAALFGFAVAAPAADLLEIYRAAQSADAIYASARAAYEAQLELLPQARASLFPVVSASASTQMNERRLQFRDPALPASQATYNSNALTLSLTQPIFNKQSFVVYDQAKSQVQQAEAQLAQAGQDLIVRVAQAYFDILLAQDNVELAAAQKAAIGEQLEQAKRNFEVGTATITDTHDAQARYDLVRSQEIAALNDLEIKKRALEQIIAKQAPALSGLGPRFTLIVPDPNNMDAWVEDAGRSNPQVLLNRATLEFANLDVERTRAGHFPTLNAFASHSETGTGSGLQGGAGNDQRSTVFGLQLAMPIFQGGLVSSQVRQAIANQEKARQNLENALRSAVLATRQAFLGVTNGAAQVRAIQTALVSSQSSLDSSRLGQQVGVRTQVDVLNAQQQLYQTRRDLSQSRYNYILSLLRLKAGVGRLSDEDLTRISAWLDKR
jgi:outer membrane protein